MLEAGVDLVTVGVFSWAHLEVGPGDYRFAWLDDVLGRLTSAGIGIDLATATASPPPWLSTLHPEMLPMTREGTRLWPGGRQAFCPSSPIYRTYAAHLCRQLAERYGDLDGLQLWHVGNELGCHNALCFCDVSATAFREWLRARYGAVDALNDAWGTAFWSQRYTDFEQVLPPRSAAASGNPTQELDFRRFSSDELLANYVAERDILHEVSPGVPVTTNFMVTEHIREMDYWAWAREVDVVSNDHYLVAADPDSYRELAFCADLTRGLAGGGPWLLMETSPSAVNWQPRNIARRPGELLRSAIQHVSRGADGVLFFQWRAARAGAEKFHAGIVPHAGTDTRVWREAVELRQVLDAVAEVAGSVVHNHVAIVFDWHAWWACELDSHPSVDVTYLDRAHALHRSLTDAGVGVDLAHPEDDLSRYDLVLVPTLYSVTDTAVDRLLAAAEGGATVLVTYFSGIVDEHDHIRLGGYPGAFRDLLGLRVEEFLPLRLGETVELSNGWTADVWAEDLRLAGAEALATYVDGPAPGVPAITRHTVGDGSAWYAACRLDRAGCDGLVAMLLAEADVAPIAVVPPGVEVTRRTADDGQSWLFVVNHTDEDVVVEAHGLDLVEDRQAEGHVSVDAGRIAVIREM
ncbi:beta-galactosidase [Nocardioides psychrotolerans]|uniref:Beta-galactosidase n=2 Tax=Nocardioides psychrotolerans TaxID=1005945 RepID=A0A1I3FZR5_9ACTN|nr:beta-galactosidase [Nocardioides psychrotolerans]